MKIKHIIFWGCVGIADLYGVSIAWNQTSQPPKPVTAEQRARNERIEKLSDALDAAREEDDEANGVDHRNDKEGPDNEWDYE